MAEGDDDSQKTEEPTQRRLDEAVKRGQVPTSREVNSFLVMLALALVVGWTSSYLMRSGTLHLTRYIERFYDFRTDDANLGHVLIEALEDAAPLILLPSLMVIVAIFAASLLQHGGFNISAYPLIPRWDKISPMKGFGRIFSMQSLVELIKGLIKISVIGIIAFIAIYPRLTILQTMHEYSIAGILAILLDLATRMLIGVCIIMALVAIVDFIYQRYSYIQGLRMTKQELKDEYKTTEGNPEIKAKIRAIRMERAKKRMMAAVPKADVIVTNPTHFSVALQYEGKKMRAPKVVAKGQDHIALMIREVAKKHDVPIYESPALARALYASVEIDDEIPLEHYKAVAEIISYVYKLKNRL